MAVPKPFKRTCRPFVDGTYPENRETKYILDDEFAEDPKQYIHAFTVIQKDLLELFDYVEPADRNKDCYSFRIHELLMRTCIEVEANCKAILEANNYPKKDNLNIKDYKKLDATHGLSKYEVKFPIWRGNNNVRCPFSSWSPSWYQAYNAAKHDRHAEFEQANFENLLQAVAGLLVLLSAQFHTEDFSEPNYLVLEDLLDREGFVSAIGSYLLVKFPTANDWPQADLYQFNWTQLKKSPDRFGTLQF
jgi:hypothetical protein